MWRKLLIKLGLKKTLMIKEVISIIEKTDKKKWTTGTVEDFEGNRCFLGHLSYAIGVKPRHTAQVLRIPQIADLDGKIKHFVRNKHGEEIWNSSIINDRQNINGYTENHPKNRILHLLEDMKKAGY